MDESKIQQDCMQVVLLCVDSLVKLMLTLKKDWKFGLEYVLVWISSVLWETDKRSIFGYGFIIYSFYTRKTNLISLEAQLMFVHCLVAFNCENSFCFWRYLSDLARPLLFEAYIYITLCFSMMKLRFQSHCYVGHH